MIKEKTKLLSYIVLSIIIPFIYGNQAIGQGLNITAGFGITELLNLGLRMEAKQFQMGFSVGTIPAKDKSIISVSGDMFVHFGGASELSDRHPWYIRIGVNYLKSESERVYNNYYFINSRIGREFNLPKKFGIEIDIGPAILISHKHENKTPASTWDLAPAVIPGIEIVLFYRI